MIHSEQIRYILYCIFLSELTVLSINGQRFDLAALSNLRAAANQPNLNTRNNLRNTILNDVNSVSTCLDSNIRFELITGYVFTAPDDMLDSRPGTLMLTDCIELCKRNSTCRSANFETGLCVLFGSSADDYPGKNLYNHVNKNGYATASVISHNYQLCVRLHILFAKYNFRGKIPERHHS